MTTQPDFTVPSWVPKPVQDEGLLLLTKAEEQADGNAHAVLKRLLTDRKMLRVWKELTKQRRDLSTYQPTGPFYKQQTPPVKLYHLVLSVNSLVGFFGAAYRFAVTPVLTVTRQQVIDMRARCDNTCLQLQKIATELRAWHNNPRVRAHFDTHMWALKSNPFPILDDLRLAHPWTDLNQVADELGKLALFFSHWTQAIAPTGPVVQRRTDRDNVRAYVLSLAGSCKIYFGSPLYSVVATTTSVALRTQVTPAFVKRCVQQH